MKFYRYLGILSFFLCSCGMNVNKELTQIEQEIETCPNCAITHLEQISQKTLNSPRNRARFALLKSIAFDKNYIDVIDDSLINLAVSFYSKTKRYPNYSMLSYYYKGLVQKNVINYPAAITTFEHAANLAKELKNYRYLGLTYRNIGDIFYLSNNMSAAADYHQRAIDVFILNRDTLYAQYAMYSLAVDFVNDLKYDESRSILRDLIINADYNLKVYSELCYAQTYVEREDSVNKAIDIYRKTPLSYYNLLDYGYRSQAFVIAGQLDSAQFWMQKGYQHAYSDEEKASLAFLQADIDYASNKKERAFKRIKKAAYVQDSLTRILLHQSLSMAQRDYYIHETELQNIKQKRQKTATAIWSVTIFLLVCLLIYYFREKTIQEEQRLKETIAQLELEKNMYGKSASALVGTLFLEKYVHLGDCIELCFGENSKQSIASFKKKLSALYNNDSAFSDLYKMLNSYVDDIIKKVSEQMPSITGDRLKTIALFFAGLPDDLIMYVVKRQSAGSLRTYRSRLKTTIKLARCADESLFLTHLERQPRKKTNI